jgi:molecular chaperone DnaJ
VLRVKGRGVVTPQGSGDLLARIQIVVPQRLSDTTREAIEKIQADEAGHDPRSDLFARAAQ